MKTKLCKMFVLFTVLCLSISSMTLVASAKFQDDDGVITVTSVNNILTPDYSYYSGGGGGSTSTTTTDSVGTWSCSTCGAKTSYAYSRATLPAGFVIVRSSSGSWLHEGPRVIKTDGIRVDASGAYGPYTLTTGRYSFGGGISTSGNSVTKSVTGTVDTVSYTHRAECSKSGRETFGGYTTSWTVSCYPSSAVTNSPSGTYTYNKTTISNPKQASELILKGCTSSGYTLPGMSISTTIKGGKFEGAPAVNSTSYTIDSATLVDTSGTSTFTLGAESESVVSQGDGKTITTVKLSNPPVIIDWADFPG